MVKFLLGVLSGILLTFFFAIFIVLLAATVGSSQPAVEQGSVLTVRLRGDIPEHVGTQFTVDWIRSGPPPTLLDLRNALEKAAEDDRIAALALQFSGLGTGWAKAEEIRYGIEKFKESGKPVVAYLSRASTLDYYVASAADEIFMAPEDFLDVKGLRAEVTFFADTLKKLGVEAEMERVGKYKSAVETFSRSSMSDESREVVNSILDDVYTRFIATVAVSRSKSEDEIRQLIDQGPFLSTDAFDGGLLDGLKYEDEFKDDLKGKLEQEKLHEISFREYYQSLTSPTDLGGGPEIAVIYAVGNIMAGRSEHDPFSGARTLGSESFNETLRSVRENDDVKAVILRVNSPGGDAFASDLMWREVNLLREKKPLIVSMSDVAASGGYYISMAQVPVLAYPGTTTGSIGVFFGKLNLRGLYDKLGIKKEILTRGQFAAIDTDYRSLTPEEREKMRTEITAFYDAFVKKVAESRGREWAEIDEVAQGRVWMGSQAQEQGLVDELGGFDRAIEMAREAAEVEDGQFRLVPYPAPTQLLEALFDSDAFAWAPLMDFPLPPALRSVLSPSLLQGGILRLAPYSITVQ
jgi:protease-4